MSENKNAGLYEEDRRKNLRSENTDRREEIRPTNRLKLFFVVVGATIAIVLFFIVYLINPKI